MDSELRPKCEFCQLKKEDVEKRDCGDLCCDDCWEEMEDAREDRIWLSEWLNASR